MEMIDDRPLCVSTRIVSLLVYGETLRLWDEAGMLPGLFEGDKRPRRSALDQPGDRLTQKRLGRAAGQRGDAGKLRREIGGNLHARSNLSSIRGRAHTTLWSGGCRWASLVPFWEGRSHLGIPSVSLPFKMKGISRADSKLAQRGYLGYLNGLKVILELVTEWV
jgi:hypothetical protein